MERVFSGKEPRGEITLVVRSEKEGIAGRRSLGGGQEAPRRGGAVEGRGKSRGPGIGFAESHVYKEALKLRKSKHSGDDKSKTKGGVMLRVMLRIVAGIILGVVFFAAFFISAAANT